MSFSKYLTERANANNEAIVVIHKIMSLVDHGHVDMNGIDVRFSIGHLIKRGDLNDVKVVIRKGAKTSVRLGTSQDGKSAIVIDTPSLPDRKGIDTLLGKKDVFDGFVAAFKSYMLTTHDTDAEYEKHDNETAMDNENGFEANYEALISEYREKHINVFEKAKAELTSYLETEATTLTSDSTKASINNLNKELLGTSVQEFMSIVKKLDGYSKFEGVSKELKTRLDSRLESFFTSEVKSLQK